MVRRTAPSRPGSAGIGGAGVRLLDAAALLRRVPRSQRRRRAADVLLLEEGLLLWLFKGGFKARVGIFEWHASNFGIDFDNSEMVATRHLQPGLGVSFGASRWQFFLEQESLQKTRSPGFYQLWPKLVVARCWDSITAILLKVKPCPKHYTPNPKPFLDPPTTFR